MLKDDLLYEYSLTNDLETITDWVFKPIHKTVQGGGPGVPIPDRSGKSKQKQDIDDGQEEETAQGGAPLFSAQDFDEKVFNNDTRQTIGDKPWFIKFFTPWCPHCRKLAPTWASLYEGQAELGVNVIKIDCDKAGTGKDVCRQVGIHGYPRMVMLKDDKMYTYSGKKRLANLADFTKSYETMAKPEDIQPIPPSEARTPPPKEKSRKKKKKVAEQEDEDEEVTLGEDPPVLNATDFNTQVFERTANGLKVRGDRPWFVMFYVTWNFWEKNPVSYEAEWKRFYNKRKAAVNIASIDCQGRHEGVANVELCDLVLRERL